MRVIIAGSRSFSDYSVLCKVIEEIGQDKFSTIISGTARGADKLGEKWARENLVQIERFPADWDRFGKSAGYRRNEEMAKVGEVLLAFWDGYSRGTKHMIDLSKKYNLIIFVYRTDKGKLEKL